MTGRPATRTRGLGTRLVSGRRRVPFPASGTMTFMSHAPVAVFESHHVVDLGRGGLEQVARRYRFELVDQLRLDVERRPLGHGPLDQRVAPLNPQDDLARQHVNGFVLLVVILKRQDVSGLDVQDLADVAVGPGPDQLVAPRFLHAVREVGHETPRTRKCERGTRNSHPALAARQLALLFRVPTSAFRILMNPGSASAMKGSSRTPSRTPRTLRSLRAGAPGAPLRPSPAPAPPPGRHGRTRRSLRPGR